MKGYLESTLLPVPYSVMGKALVPFTFGHFIILRAFKVGIVADEKSRRTTDDLIFSVFACSHTWNECKNLIYSGQYAKEVEAWGIQFQDKNVLTDEKYWIEQSLLFDRYLEAHTDIPHFHPLNGVNQAPKRHHSSQWYEKIIDWLAKQNNSSYEAVMDIVFQQGVYQYLNAKEEQGQIQFYTDTLEDVVRAKKKELRDKLIYGT